LPGELRHASQVVSLVDEFPSFTLTSVTFYSAPTTSDMTVLFVVGNGSVSVYTAEVTIPASTTDQTITTSLTSPTFPAGPYGFGWDSTNTPYNLNFYIANDVYWCGIVYGQLIN
jgi:hypothetical protein